MLGLSRSVFRGVSRGVGLYGLISGPLSTSIAEAILHYDAEVAPLAELVGGVHTLNHSVLGPQYQCLADGSYIDVGAQPAVDVLDGGIKGLRTCGAITNLLPGDTSMARAVTLTAQSYTLQVIGAGTVSCSYGIASVGTPLTFTATAGTTPFTPSGATLWILTATAYPTPYVPPGVTQPASSATATNGTWFDNPNGSPLWLALTGSPFSLATRIKMGIGSADLPVSAIYNLFSASISSDILHISKGGAGESRIARSYDGATAAQILNVAWSRNAIIYRITQVNDAGNRFRVGYMIEGTHTEIQWSHTGDSATWAVYDGSFNPSTLYRLMIGYNNPYPMWINKITAWKRTLSGAEILEAWS